MEVSHVRNRLKRAIETARDRAQQQRQHAAEAERAYEDFLQNVATPVLRQLTNALKVEGYAFTLFTPGGSLRLASDRGRDDYVELTLDTAADPPQVIGRISHTRGSRTDSREAPIKADTPPGALTDEDVLAFLLDALRPWIER